MTIAEAQAAVARAREAQSAWSELSVRQRSTFLSRLGRQMANQCDGIANLVAQDATKHPLDALSGDVLVTLEHLRFCEIYGPEILRSQKRSKPPFFFRGVSFESFFEPHGVVLIFAPSNYPLQLSLVPLTTALIAGNSAIVKCSERTPETAKLIKTLCADAGFPSGLVQVTHDDPGSASTLIDAKPDFIFFTGSTQSGRLVAEQAAPHLIPCIFELGGKDATIVFSDCQIERAIEGIAYGAFSNTGRVCVAVRRGYVQASIWKTFLTALKERAERLRVGTEADADFPPLPATERARFCGQVEDAIIRGATLLSPRSCKEVTSQPVILTKVPKDARILMEESFGPALCLAPFDTEEEAVSLANEGPYSLSSSVWTGDRRRGQRVARTISAGSCSINDVIRAIANPHAPFGGNGSSGYGRYHGAEGLRAFSRVKTVTSARTRRKREINWFPFRSQTFPQLARLLRLRHGQSGIVARLGRILLPILLCVVIPAANSEQSPVQAHLAVIVQLTPGARGDLGYLVFGSPSGFPGDRKLALRHGFLPIRADARQIQINLVLSPGTYAVSVYEDLNGNHNLDHNWLGIPCEPVGASNNPPARYGPPKFTESSFQLNKETQTITVRMVRP